jgi:hypothetical protein
VVYPAPFAAEIGHVRDHRRWLAPTSLSESRDPT